MEREKKEKERIRKEKEKKEREILLNKINEKYNIIKDDLPIPFYMNQARLIKYKNEDKCLICLGMFKLNEQVLYLKCFHLFHSICILTWFLEKDTCPICKKKYNEKLVFNDDIPSNLSTFIFY